MEPLTYLTLVLALGISAQWIAWRLKLPSILLLLAFGFGLGYFTGVRIDDFLVSGDNSPLLPGVGLLVAIILFEGGLTLKFSELKESGAPVIRLCSVGALVSFVMTTAFAAYVLNYDLRVAALLGAILVVTGPTVVAPLLRHIKPSKKVGSIVKWEGIVIDPIGAILAVLVFQVSIAGNFSDAGETLFLAIFKTAIVGVIGGFLLSKLIEILIRKHLIPDYLQAVFLLSVVAVAFTASNAFQKESGLLTVTVMGIALANQKSTSVKHILEFKENLRVLIISSLFIILSGRIDTANLKEVAIHGLLILAILIFIIRPASVFIANWGSKQTSFKEKVFLSALAPRGIVAAAVTAIFALELEHEAKEGHLPAIVGEQAGALVPLVFIVIVGTVAFYGLLAAPIARRLGLAKKNASGILFAGAPEWAILAAECLLKEGHAVMMLDTNYKNVADAKIRGIEAHRANILSEFAEEELDFGALSNLIACTPNDEVNSMATENFTHHFGSVGVWQIAPMDRDHHHTNAVSHHKRGRIAFPGAPTLNDLERLAQKGAKVKKTTITDVFTLEDFRLTHGDEPIILFTYDEAKGIRPVGENLDKITSGTDIFALMPSSKNSKNGES